MNQLMRILPKERGKNIISISKRDLELVCLFESKTHMVFSRKVLFKISLLIKRTIRRQSIKTREKRRRLRNLKVKAGNFVQVATF